jgi:hypothetical protein
MDDYEKREECFCRKLMIYKSLKLEIRQDSCPFQIKPSHGVMWANCWRFEVKQWHSGEARKAGPTGTAQAVEGEGDKAAW